MIIGILGVKTTNYFLINISFPADLLLILTVISTFLAKSGLFSCETWLPDEAALLLVFILVCI